MDQHPHRVLFHPTFFLPESWNGMDEHMLLLARHLDRRRFEPMVIASPSDGAQTRVLAERAGIRALRAPYAPDASPRERLMALRRLYARERVDILHLHSPTAAAQAIPALAARLAGARGTVATYHQIQAWRFPARTRALNALTHTLLVDVTAGVSGGVRDTLAGMAGLRRRGLRVLHNGIDLEPSVTALGPLPERGRSEVRIGYFGRLSSEKGVSGLLDALALLAPRAPQARTLLVGDGPERPALEAQAARLGIADRVVFLGFRADARRIMDEVDIVAHVPVYEGFGLVLIEAMAAGRPVVTNTAPGGIPNIVVDGTTGLVAPLGDAQAVAGALARLAADPAERRRLGENGRGRCEAEFSAQRMAERTAALYDEILGRTPPGRALARRVAWVGR